MAVREHVSRLVIETESYLPMKRRGGCWPSVDKPIWPDGNHSMKQIPIAISPPKSRSYKQTVGFNKNGSAFHLNGKPFDAVSLSQSKPYEKTRRYSPAVWRGKVDLHCIPKPPPFSPNSISNWFLFYNSGSSSLFPSLMTNGQPKRKKDPSYNYSWCWKKPFSKQTPRWNENSWPRLFGSR